MGIAKILINWYNTNQRDLPWRKTKNPYTIWVSEIILQQTQIKQGTPYFNFFIEKFPNIEQLANSNINDVLHLWQGLGYYSRARNMHFAANQIINDYNSTFPKNYKELLKIKGIGEYTAAAIASFCYNEAVPAIDGNVYRVITRLFDIETPIDSSLGKKQVKEIVTQLIPDSKPGDFNQAIMDFGSTVCKPKLPLCQNCPLNSKCLAKKHNVVLSRPIKSNKTKQRTRFFTYLFICDNKSVLIEQRKGKDIWEGLFQIPLIETDSEPSIDDICSNKLFKQFIMDESKIEFINGGQHILSHQKINYNFIKYETTKLDSLHTLKIPISKLKDYAFPVLLSNFFQDFVNT